MSSDSKMFHFIAQNQAVRFFSGFLARYEIFIDTHTNFNFVNVNKLEFSPRRT